MQIRSIASLAQDRDVFAPAWQLGGIVSHAKWQKSCFVFQRKNFFLSMRGQPFSRNSLFALGHSIAAIIVLFLHCHMFYATAGAQTKAKLTISEQLVITPNRPIPFPIRYETIGGLPPQTFIRIRNLPPKTILTEGYRVSDTTWAIPLDRRLQVHLRHPGMLSADKAVRIQLVSLDGKVYAEASVRLFSGITPPAPPTLASQDLKRQSKLRQQAEDVMSATSDLSIGGILDTLDKAAAPNASSQGDTPAPAAGPPASAALPEGQQAARRLVVKGNEFLLQGNINTARLFYRRAADLGFADAAMALAATFDPNELSGLGIIGMEGNEDQALRWYKHAAELGNPIATERLKRLLK